MAWLALVAQAGGAVLNAQGTKAAANAQADALDEQATQDNETANLTQDSGYQAARRIRTQGQTNIGAANASLAASGVDVNSSTANDIRTKITQNAEDDALNTILNTDNRATNQRLQAGFEENAALDARKAGQTALAKSALSSLAGGAQSSSGWKTAAGSSASSADANADMPYVSLSGNGG